ncbi:MAG: hypothetical protein ACO1PZ_04405 [Gammaproteobacteria bacterium]
MSRYQATTALHYEPSVHPASIGQLFKVFEQSDEQLRIAKLNLKLQQQCGEDFALQFYSGDDLERLPRSTLISMAQCYAEVFNESWGEDWTLDSALEEVTKFINCDTRYTPVMSLLFKEERVVGFSWGFLMDADSLTDDSAPFSASALKRHESIEVARYWLGNVSKHNRFLSIRELGVIKEFRQDKTPYLTIPLFEKAKSVDCNVAFFRTKITSKAFKWSLGVGFVPLQLFMVDGLLLMKGSVKYAMNLLYGSIDDAARRKSQVEIIGNIKRYLCE